MKILVILVAVIASVCGRSVGGGDQGYVYDLPKVEDVRSSSDSENRFGIKTNFNNNGNAFDEESPFNKAPDTSNLEPIIVKHYYLHIAPEEPQFKQIKTRYVQSPPVKNYKIIFVKVPAQVQPQRTEVILPPKIEEKTVVYVLVKKPEESVQEIRIPAAEQTKPTQPEVFFVKYKSEKKIKGDIEGVSGVDVFSTSGKTKTEDEVNRDLSETSGIGSISRATVGVSQSGNSEDSVNGDLSETFSIGSINQATVDVSQSGNSEDSEYSLDTSDGGDSNANNAFRKPQSVYGNPA